MGWTIEDIQSLFELAKCGSDFCVDKQIDKVVCGGWNRVYLYPDGSIKISESHCSCKFLDVCTQLGIRKKGGNKNGYTRTGNEKV